MGKGILIMRLGYVGEEGRGSWERYFDHETWIRVSTVLVTDQSDSWGGRGVVIVMRLRYLLRLNTFPTASCGGKVVF